MKVGRITRVLEDFKRKETLLNNGENRRIIISFYYPVDETWKENRQALYMDMYYPKKDESITKLSQLILDNNLEKKKRLEKMKTNIYNDAPICTKKTTYPVIIQSSGLGAPRDYMTFTIEELINEGYVVFTIGHFYDSMLTILPNGEIIQNLNKELTQEDKKNIIDIRKDDILFLLDSLDKLNQDDNVIKNKLDLEKIGLLGHSLGGAAVFKASQYDSRIKASVLYDASLQFFNLNQYIKDKQKLNIPVLNFRRDNFNYETSMKTFIDYLKIKKIDGEKFKKGIIINDSVLRDSAIEQKNLFRYLCNYKSFIKLNKSNHMTFTDYPILIENRIDSDTSFLNKAHQIINELTIRFLNEFLKGDKKVYRDFIKNNEYITLIDENGQPI